MLRIERITLVYLHKDVALKKEEGGVGSNSRERACFSYSLILSGKVVRNTFANNY